MVASLQASAAGDMHLPDVPQEVYEPKHVPALDGVRGVAIAMVVLTHLGAILRDFGFVRYFEFGWMGVDLFFVLSGFLITRILLDTRNDERYFRRFYIRRGLRIWPLYYVYLGLTLLFLSVMGHLAQKGSAAGGGHFDFAMTSPVWLYLLFVQNLNPASLFSLRDAMLAITWSLCIEEHFYLAWPVCVRNFSRRALRWILIAILAASPFLRLAAAHVGRNKPYNFWYQMVNRCTPFHLDSITAGCLLCLVWLSIGRHRGSIYFFASLFAAGLCGTVFCLMGGRNASVFSFCYTALAAMFSGLVGLTLLGRFTAIFTQPFLRYLGKISFGLYLIHPSLFVIFQSHRVFDRLGMARHILVAECVAALLACALSLSLAHLSWKFFESRVLSLKARLAP
jgi:peptidoglycan/LPS O-acetylase OafA/YrhL